MLSRQDGLQRATKKEKQAGPVKNASITSKSCCTIAPSNKGHCGVIEDQCKHVNLLSKVITSVYVYLILKSAHLQKSTKKRFERV
jgi:hypothetical protein